MVVGASPANVNGQQTGGQTVYFYNGNSVIATMPLNVFVRIP